MSSAMRLLDTVSPSPSTPLSGTKELPGSALNRQEMPAAIRPTSRRSFPFAAIVGQDELKNALLIAAVDPTIGGVLVFGDRGTGKSTAVRALADLLPPIEVIEDCPYACDPKNHEACPNCAPLAASQPRRTRSIQVPMIDLPLGATEDRILGALDLERALVSGEKAFQPGLLARANRGFLYIDEVNLLEDHLVDLLIDVAASGVNVVERDGISVCHPARFVLVGSGNPEEGELRPQLLDRFGLCVEVRTPEEIDQRVEIVRRRDDFERNPAAFCEKWSDDAAQISAQVSSARARLADVRVPDAVVETCARLCTALRTDGLRGELTLVRAARALASLEVCSTVDLAHVRGIALASLRHRLRRSPLEEAGSDARLHRVVAEHLGI
jgi:magnesium chelatase subunit I